MKSLILLSLFLAAACSGPQTGFDLDALAEGVTLEGSIQCKGDADLTLWVVKARVEGLASTSGNLDDGGACAGVAITVGPFRWVFVAESNEKCDLEPGLTFTKADP